MNRIKRLLPLVATALLCALAGACVRTSVKQATLYDQLGGGEGIHAITEGMIDRFARDPLVTPLFAHIDIPRFSAHFSEFICQVADGPCRYDGDSLAEVHRGMDINEAQFNAVVQDLIAAMDAQHLSVRVQNRLIARLAAMHQSVVYQ